jgi:hypothetical protein
MNKNEVSRLHESINNHPDGIILTGSQRQTHDEIHIDIFPLPGMSIQWLQQTSKPQMICIDPSTSVAFCHIASSLAFHSCPLELRFQVMIHFGVAGVNRILGCVCFIKDLLSQPLVTWNDYSAFELKHPFIIHMETANLGITLGQPSLYV